MRILRMASALRAERTRAQSPERTLRLQTTAELNQPNVVERAQRAKASGRISSPRDSPSQSPIAGTFRLPAIRSWAYSAPLRSLHFGRQSGRRRRSPVTSAPGGITAQEMMQ